MVRRIKEALYQKKQELVKVRVHQVFIFLKKNESIKSFSMIYSETKKIPTFYNSIFPNLFPKTIEDIKSAPVMDFSIDKDKDVVWISFLLLENVDCINNFIQCEQQYEKNYLTGNYSNCENILDDIDMKICVSSWSMEKRIILKQKKYGLKEQKKLTDNYKKSSK